MPTRLLNEYAELMQTDHDKITPLDNEQLRAKSLQMDLPEDLGSWSKLVKACCGLSPLCFLNIYQYCIM